MRWRDAIAALIAAGALTFDGRGAWAQTLDQPPPPKARDIAFPGMITLNVDATDLRRHIFQVHETIPVKGGAPLTLLYPKWLPGDHSPSGPIARLAGLEIHAGDRRIEWVRDTIDVYAFHLTPPADATSIDLDFQFLSAIRESEGRIVMTPGMLNLEWDSMSLYPAGYYTRRIPVTASITLPEGWSFGTALETSSAKGAATTFKTVPYETLVDSPMFAGRYFKRFDLDPGAATPVALDIVADRPELLEVTPEQLAAHRALVRQAYGLFGSRHYDHYDFLLAVTDEMSGIGLEHHRSSEDGARAEYFTGWATDADDRTLLPHEFTHSWNGKFRRPADLWTPDYATPMQDSLLWVYEGQTEYWGVVLAARAGLLSRQQTLDSIALIAAGLDAQPGRQWRALQDTTNSPIMADRRPLPWITWARDEDYYSEGELIWLDVDTLIRERSGGKRSLDDFARAFFGVEDGAFGELTYRFDDVVKALNAVEPYDWASFLRTRLDGHGPGAPLDGLTRGGYHLIYTETPSDYQKNLSAAEKFQDYSFSLGLSVGRGDTLTRILWDGPAFKAGMTPGATLLAVNVVAYTSDRLNAAITAAKGGGAPIELLVKTGDRYATVKLDYHGGLRYPHLEKIAKGQASLDGILAPKS
jgi:predicted metalloprotease with PDZ domain